MSQALAGLRVLDLSRLLPGPYCTQFLADFGADVIKIEDTELGDYARILPPMLKGVGVSHLILDRNKRSVALNLKAEPAREVFYRLAERADVVLESFRPGVVKRLGIDYDTISKINPRIVYCSLSGYGQSGPYEQLVGHDINYLAFGGVIGVTGPSGGPPVLPGVQIADIGGGGLMSLVGILIALQARERTGRGQYLDVAMLDGAVSWLVLPASFYIAEGRSPQLGEMRTAGSDPGYNVYQCKDGKYFTIGPLEPQFWANLCRALGREDLITHQNPDDPKERAEVAQTLKGIFLTKTRDEWFALLKDHEICIGPVNSVEEVFRDPQVLHRQMILDDEHPAVGKIKQIGIPIKMSDTPGSIRTPAPAQGQQTNEILGELGYSREQIEALRQAKAIR